MRNIQCPTCGHETTTEATCPGCGHAASNGVVRSAWIKPPPPPEVANWVITPTPPEMLKHLRETFAGLDPILLLNRIRASQHKIAGIEVRGGPVEPSKIDQNLEEFVGNLGIAWKAGEVRSTHRKPNTGPRYWRTRVDPFENTWQTIETWLNEQPDANAKELLQRLHANGVDIQPRQLRTLQRRVKTWRTDIARRLILGCDTVTSATEGKKEEVTI